MPKPIVGMTDVDKNNLEKVLQTFHRAKAAIALEGMQRASVQAGTDKMTDEEIELQIKAVRSTRKS